MYAIRSYYDLLNKAVGVIKGYIGNEKEILEDIVKLRSRKLSNIVITSYSIHYPKLYDATILT